MNSWFNRLREYLGKQRNFQIAVIALVVLYATLLAQGINRPFFGLHDDNAGVFGMAAINWVQYGPAELGFSQMMGVWESVFFPAASRVLYLNHPQFITAPLALSYQLFGVGEWQTRIVPIVFSLLALLAFMLFINVYFKNRALTFLSGFFFTIFPISIYFGKMMCHEPIALFFIVALYFFLIRTIQLEKRRYLIAYFITAFIGGLIDWPFFFALVAAWLYVLVSPSSRYQKAFLIYTPAIAILSLLVTFLQITLLSGSAGVSGILSAFLTRSTESPSLINWLGYRGYFDAVNFTEIGIILILIGLFLFVRKNNREPGQNWGVILLLFIPGFLHVMIFRNGSALHQYWTYYLIPFCALMAAWALSKARSVILAGLIMVAMIASSVSYAMFLEQKRPFSNDDIVLAKKADAGGVTAGRDSVCFGDNAAAANIQFYLKNGYSVFPCQSAEYYILRRWDNLLSRGSIPSALITHTFKQNREMLGSIAISALGATIQRIPLLQGKIQKIVGASDMFYQSLKNQAKVGEDLIKDRNLRVVSCSQNFCLYHRQ